MMLSRLRSPIGILMAVLLVAGVLGGVALATTGDDTFYACAKDGRIKAWTIRVNHAPRCWGDSHVVSWNAEGPQGPQGEPGPHGVDGQDGADGVSGYEVVERFWPDTLVQPGALISFQTWCPADKSVIGGGYAYANFDLGALIVEDSFPITQEGTHKWRVQWRNVSDTAVTDDLQIWATCAYVS